MTHRRMDAIYVALFLVVSLVGYFVANRANQATDEAGMLTLPTFEAPEFSFEVPFDFPYAVVKFKQRRAPTLQLSGNMESVLTEVRSALLESSARDEVREDGQLASLVD